MVTVELMRKRVTGNRYCESRHQQQLSACKISDTNIVSPSGRSSLDSQKITLGPGGFRLSVSNPVLSLIEPTGENGCAQRPRERGVR